MKTVVERQSHIHRELPTPNPMTPIGNEELSIRPHQSILDTVDQELSSVEGVYGEAEKISRLEDLDTEIWDDINIEDGPMGLLYKYQDTLFSLFQMHATQDMQFRGGATSHDRSRIRSRSGDSTGSAGKKYRRHYIMGRHGFFAFVKKYRILHDLLSRVAVDNVFMSSSEDVSSNGSSLPCLTFKGFFGGADALCKLAYGRPEDGESTGDIAAALTRCIASCFESILEERISKAFKSDTNLSNRSAWSLRKLCKKTLQVTGCVRIIKILLQKPHAT